MFSSLVQLGDNSKNGMPVLFINLGFRTWQTCHVNRVLFCDYSESPTLAVSSSPGDISLVRGEEVIEHWHAHDFEAWITAFNYYDANIVWSGMYSNWLL